MKKRITIVGLFFLLCMAVTGSAQVKIGYTNLEFILANHPKARTMQQQLATYEQKLGERLKVKDDYAKQKYQEYVEGVEANRFSPEVKKQKEDELVKLDTEVKQMAQQAEFDLMAKQQELLAPILEELQKAIDGVAQENGYTYILNQTTSAGVSTILYGPDEDDLTEKIMGKLGIPMPKSE